MKTITNLFILMFLSLSLFAQRNTGLNNTNASSANQATAAKNFGITIVQSYFQSNCPSVYEKLSSQVTDVQPQFLSPSTFVVTNKDVIRKTDFCAASPLKDKTTPYTSYTANYQPTIMDHNQFRVNYPRQAMLFNLTNGDFFFDGSVLKAGGVSLFNNPSVLQFVVRKNSRGQFEITKITLP
jgi:hypothetical protein